MITREPPHRESRPSLARQAARSPAKAFIALFSVLCVLAAFPARASEYTVSPMRMELDRDTRSTVVTLNNTGSDRIEFQLKAMAWTQDAEGRDRYADTAEIVFFPKILSLDPNESRVVRVGIKSVPVATEQTYRLFIEKIPAPNPAPPPPGAQVAINLRFALPIFVKPPTHQARGEIINATVSRGELVLMVKNDGNEHFRMDDGIALTGRDAQGNEVFTRKLDDRYVLAGATKRVATTIAKDTCVQLATMEVTAKTEQFTLSRKFDVNRTSCE